MQWASRSRRLQAVVSAAVLAAGALAVRGDPQQTAASPQPRAAARAVTPANPYVNPELCAQCHPDVARTFRKTGMGRSFSRLSAQNLVEGFKSGRPFYHEASDSYFAMIERGGKYYQRRWQLGSDGKETNTEEKQVDFVLGSGNHARTYLHLTTRNTLQQLPLGWYAEKGGSWGMNPGYDRPDYQGSTRAIHYECMFCHNSYPRIPQGHQEPGSEAQYLQPIPEGIDCQRCHGPGQQHITAAAKPDAKPEEIRAAIVNSARLSPAREMEVCMQCHLETTSRLLPHSLQRADRALFSYLPGQPLADFRLSFDRAPGKNEDFEVAHAAYRLRESQCFLKSEEKLRCTTCHNPHDTPRGEAAASHYNNVCSSCHGAALERIPAHTAAANCVSCHMPRRRTDDAVHIVMTDHKIIRRPPPGDLLAEKKEKHDSPATSYRGEVLPYYPEEPAATPATELDLALAQVTDRSNLEAGIRRLSSLIERYHPAGARYYAGIGEAYRSAGNNSRAILSFQEAVRRAPASEIVLLQLGNALMESGQWAKAEAALRQAKTLRPKDAAAWALLGWVLWQQDKRAEARAAFDTGLKLDPDLPDLHNYLASWLIGTGDAAGAEKEFLAAVRINPGVAEWQVNLAKLQAARGELTEASFHAKAAVHANPDLAAAHELWGRLLSAKDDFAGAARELQAAIQLKPDAWLAHYELGVAFAQMGNSAAAVEHLRMAAQGTDPQAKAAAAEVLRRLGK